MLLTSADIVTFFDRKNIYDIIQPWSEIGVNQKAARVWFKLNEGTQISVKTAGYVGECIGLGTAGGALVYQANLYTVIW